MFVTATIPNFGVLFGVMTWHRDRISSASRRNLEEGTFCPLPASFKYMIGNEVTTIRRNSRELSPHVHHECLRVIVNRPDAPSKNLLPGYKLSEMSGVRPLGHAQIDPSQAGTLHMALPRMTV
jgi:hypothetical protein